MKKWIVMAAMALSMTMMFTACGAKSDTTSDTDVSGEQTEDTDTTQDQDADSTQETDADTQEESEETSDDADDTDSDTDDDAKSSKKDTTEDSDDGEETELIETGETPDFKLNKNGCFNGKYEGNDGCIYKFTKKGILTVTSDSETLEYNYEIDGDSLNMIMTDGSMGQSLHISQLEDGTYLLDNTMGTQVVLTYME